MYYCSHPPVEEEDESDCQSSSETSTIETFNTYKEKVALLLASLFSYDVASQAVLSRLKGGSYNRITGISMPSGTDPDHCTSEELILRVPRFEAADVQAESLLLIHLYKTKANPPPEIICYDSSLSCCIRMYGSSLCFLLQQLKGESLLTAHSKMNLNVFHWPRRSRNSSRRSTITQSRQALGLLSLYVRW